MLEPYLFSHQSLRSVVFTPIPCSDVFCFILLACIKIGYHSVTMLVLIIAFCTVIMFMKTDVNIVVRG